MLWRSEFEVECGWDWGVVGGNWGGWTLTMVFLAKEIAQWQAQTVYRNVDE